MSEFKAGDKVRYHWKFNAEFAEETYERHLQWFPALVNGAVFTIVKPIKLADDSYVIDNPEKDIVFDFEIELVEE